MKKLLLMAIAIGLSSHIFSQDLVGRWKIKKWGISFGQDQDMLKNLDHTYLMSTVKGNPDYNYGDIPFGTRDVASMTCENPNIRLEVTLLPPRMRNTELRVALAGMFGRVDAVHFSRTPSDDSDYNTLSFTSWTNEIAPEVVLLKRASLGNWLHAYGGAGTNVGISFSGDMAVYGENLVLNNSGTIMAPDDPFVQFTDERMDYFYDNYEIKNGLHQRAFLQAGFGITMFRRVELGADFRYGLGYRLIGGEAKSTRLESAAFTLKWVLR